MKRTLTAATAALLVLASIAMAVGPGVAAAQSDPYTVEIEAPENFSTDGVQTLAVTVTNRDESDLLNPIVEVPIDSPLSLTPDAADTVYVNDTSDTRLAEVRESTFETGDALFVTGDVVPAGESRTYHFNVTVSAPGSTSVTADVRPMYNEQQNVRASETVTALGTGTVDATVENADGTEAGDSTVLIDGEPVGSSVSQTVVEGTHTVSVGGAAAPSFDVSLGPGDTRSVTFVERTEDTQPVAYTGSDVTRLGESRRLLDGSATESVDTQVSVTFAKDGGTVVYDVGRPDRPVRSAGAATVSSGNKIDESAVNDGKRVRINQTGTTTQVTITYEGYELGNVNGDRGVTSDDATRIARRLSEGNEESVELAYGDVNGDGRVSAIDAMMIEQYHDGNRTADYAPDGGA